MQIPIFPLQAVLFPGAMLPLHIFEPRYRQMIKDCEAGSMEFGVVQADKDGLSVTGCIAKIVNVMQRYEDGRLDIMTRGDRRFQIQSLDEGEAYLRADVEFLGDAEDPAPRSLREAALALHFEALQHMGHDVGTDGADLPLLQLDRPISFLLAGALPLPLQAKQGLLCIDSDRVRTEMLLQIYDELLPQLRMQNADRQSGTSRLVH